ncbi:MAG: hypothetical protein KME08_05850 [Aphanothece sp. CMT-3BRIN-NPC111]|jgi:deoxycytidine triphosphate deaminase|nr:hypothetical protein [Aphanothece sp. CMT-3BRIN-NPC111]
MSVLSESDIIKKLGKYIFIYPFIGKDSSIRGCCLCLTASKYAYTFLINKNAQGLTPQRLTIQNDNNKDFFIIPARNTAVVWTNESVLLKNYFCGSVHSKVKLASKGIGHIGTRVNPNYGGVLAIALHNLSDNDIRIEVNETIAYLRIHKLNSKSSFSQQIDDPGKLRDAIPEGFSIPPELNKWINEENWRKGDQEALLKVGKENYENARKELWEKSRPYQVIFKYFQGWDIKWIVGTLLTVLGVIGTWWFIIKPSSPPSLVPTQTVAPKTQVVPTSESAPATK